MHLGDLRTRVMKVLAALMIVICCVHAVAREFKIPEVGELPRIDRSSPRPAREVLRNSAYILKFKEHAPIGNGYVILTDHSEEDYPYADESKNLATTMQYWQQVCISFSDIEILSLHLPQHHLDISSMLLP
mgnify:CR=1 FL=1